MAMERRATVAAAVAVAASLSVVAIWATRERAPGTDAQSALEATRAARVVRHDALGFPVAQGALREPARVRALVVALGVDAQPEVPCPADYGAAEISVVLAGADAYARRSVYLFGVVTPSSERPRVLVVSSRGCRGGPPADLEGVRRSIAAALE